MSSKNSPETCLVYITVVFVDGPRVCVRVTAKSKVNQIVNGEANFKSSALYLLLLMLLYCIIILVLHGSGVKVVILQVANYIICS